MSSTKLTVHDVNLLAVLMRAAQTSARVTFIPPGEIVKIRTGTVRHVVSGPEPQQWGFPGGDYDVRDAYLRITDSAGFDTAFPIRDLMQCVDRGEFVIDSEAGR